MTCGHRQEKQGSPVSDGGRGLKHLIQSVRMGKPDGSPVSDGGRGLKQRGRSGATWWDWGSPVSDGGRGLKLAFALWFVTVTLAVRPSAMAGVD